MRKASGILADTTELRKMIMKHPDYPIAVVVGEEANSGDYSWMYASDITFSLGEILDTEQPVNNEMIFNDKDDFYEKLEEYTIGFEKPFSLSNLNLLKLEITFGFII